MSNILVRTVTGAFFISLILGALIYDGIAAVVVFGIFALLGIYEFYGLFKKHETIRINPASGTVVAMLIFIYTVLEQLTSWRFPISPTIFGITLLFALSVVELWKKKNIAPLLNSSVNIFGIFYVIIPFLMLSAMSFTKDGKFPVLVGFFLIIWSNDTFAYLSGRFFGKHKLFERISPKKTWEGTFGGILFALITGTIIGYFTDNMIYWILSGLLIAPCAILGDLMESQFKRSLNIKDSGSILPGHGGILDRFDATLFAVPVFLAWNQLYFTYFA